jgi:hypothetical protein
MKNPKFTLRDLFWLIALVAMGLGWWVEHRRTSLQRTCDKAEIERLISESQKISDYKEVLDFLQYIRAGEHDGHWTFTTDVGEHRINVTTDGALTKSQPREESNPN